MFSNNSLNVQPVEAPELQQKIDVVLDNSPAGDGPLTIKLSTWTDGLGWCVQKTLQVEADQIDELQRTLTMARHRMNRKRGEAGLPTQSAKVIRLPFVGDTV